MTLPLSADLESFLARLLLDALVATVLVQVIYVRRTIRSELPPTAGNPPAASVSRPWEFAFTGYVFNLVTFCLCAVLQKIPVEIGFALGLFGVFGILRYRTEPMSSRDLTYLFALIGLAMIHALVDPRVNLDVVVIVDLVLTLGVGVLDRPTRDAVRVPVLYDRLELLDPARRSELEADLVARIGRPIRAVEVEGIDLLQDSARLRVEFADRTPPGTGPGHGR